MKGVKKAQRAKNENTIIKKMLSGLKRLFLKKFDTKYCSP